MHTHTHLAAVGAHDARHCHRNLKALFKRLHRLVFVALHVQQPCAQEQRILLEVRGVIRTVLLLLVELYGPLERVQSLKHLVLHVPTHFKFWIQGFWYARTCTHTWSVHCLPEARLN